MNRQDPVPQDFWEEHYRAKDRPPDGIPSAVLTRFAAGRTPGTALDLGCARGDDAVWLGARGWTVTGVDIAPLAIEEARRSAAGAGVTERVTFLQLDLETRFPDGRFDLVAATFLQTPLAFPRLAVLRRAAGAVRSGGLLLVTTHHSTPPWVRHDPPDVLPDGPQRLAELDLEAANWKTVFVGQIEREARGPGGRTATVTDAVVALERQGAVPTDGTAI